MRPVSDLYGRHSGSDVYVVGTGASLRVFPVDFLDGRVTVGLNMAWRHVPVQYGITSHPDLNIPEFLTGCEPRPEITWVVKQGKVRGLPDAQVRHAEEHFYGYRTGSRDGTRAVPAIPGRDDSARELEWLRTRTDFLYQWTSISQAGVNLAVHLGARNVVLVGCDNTALLGNHHAHDQHTRWLGAAPDDRYHDYYEGLAEIRGVLRELGVNLVSLTPFLTLGPHDEDFLGLCRELDVPTLVEGTDITDTYVAPIERHHRALAERETRAVRPLRRWARTIRRRVQR